MVHVVHVVYLIYMMEKIMTVTQIACQEINYEIGKQQMGCQTRCA